MVIIDPPAHRQNTEVISINQRFSPPAEMLLAGAVNRWVSIKLNAGRYRNRKRSVFLFVLVPIPISRRVVNVSKASDLWSLIKGQSVRRDQMMLDCPTDAEEYG